jgi:hypothetical protein
LVFSRVRAFFGKLFGLRSRDAVSLGRPEPRVSSSRDEAAPPAVWR